MANDNSGALFANDKREKDTHPTHTGTATINGVDYWVSAWVKEKNGRKYFSMSYREKEHQGGSKSQRQASRNTEAPSGGGFDDESIPF